VITVEVNPKGRDDEFLKCLNFCFDGWGDRKKYEWHFRRKTVYPETDLIFLKKNNDLAAGSAVTYRKVALPNDKEITVGIIGSTWTLPSFRNQGYFARITEESLRLTALKGGVLLLGFTVADRPSFRQLTRAGSADFPCSYLFSTARTKCPEQKSKLRFAKKSRPVIAELFARLSTSGNGYARFLYASEQAFDSQFIYRPGETEIFADDYGNSGIIEKTEDTDILQLYLSNSDDESSMTESLASILSYTLSAGRKLFLYSSQPGLVNLSRRVGLEVKAGYLNVLIAEESRLRDALGILGSAPIEDTKLLARADSDWFLGNWKLQAGDRA